MEKGEWLWLSPSASKECIRLTQIEVAGHLAMIAIVGLQGI